MTGEIVPVPVRNNPFEEEGEIKKTPVTQNPFNSTGVTTNPPDFDWGEAARTTLQGYTFGTSDEIGAAVAAIPLALQEEGGFLDNYKRITAEIHGTLGDQQDVFRKDNPGAAFGLEMAGGTATGIATASKIAGLKSLEALGRYKKAAAIGGGEAAAYGFASGRDLPDRAQKAGLGMLSGATLGPTFQLAGDVVGAVGKPLYNRAKRALFGTDRGDARGALVDTLAGEGIDSISDLAETDARIAPTLADQSEGARDLAGGLASDANTPAVRKRVETFLGGRNEALTQRAHDALDEGLEIPANTTLKEASDFIKETRSGLAAPLYKKASETPYNASQYVRTMLSEKGPEKARTALKKAQDSIGASRAAGDEVGHFDLINKWKMYMDDSIESLLRGGEKGEARDLIRINRRVIADIDEQIPEYKQARDIWSDSESMMDAGNRGRKIFSEDVDGMDELIAGMSKSELRMYRLGARKAIREKLMVGREGTNTVNRIMGQLNLERIRKAFPTEKAFQQFKREMKAEVDAFQTYHVVAQNSATARRLSAQAKIDGKAAPAGVVSPGFVDTVANGLRRLFSAPGLSAQGREELGRLILTPIKDLDPKEIQKIQAMLTKRLGKEQGKEVAGFFSDINKGASYAPTVITAMGTNNAIQR